MLITSYELEVGISTHSVQEFEYEATAHLAVDISAVLPYLNAALNRATYAPNGPALSWRRDGRNIGFWSNRIAADHLEDRVHAEQVMAELVALVNQVWSKRAEIEPDFTTRQRLQPLELHRLLPRTNCKACGEATCFAFALKLAAGQVELIACSPLFEDEAYQRQRTALEKLVATKWPLL
jgi:ArsR family metal-binding transcriptional regulator